MKRLLLFLLIGLSLDTNSQCNTYAISWSGAGDYFLQSFNVSNGTTSNIGTMSGVTSVFQGAEFDPTTGLIVFPGRNASSTYTIFTVDPSDASVNAYTPPSQDDHFINVNGEMYVLSWSGSGDYFLQTFDASNGTTSYIGTLTGVTSVFAGAEYDAATGLIVFGGRNASSTYTVFTVDPPTAVVAAYTPPSQDDIFVNVNGQLYVMSWSGSGEYYLQTYNASTGSATNVGTLSGVTSVYFGSEYDESTSRIIFPGKNASSTYTVFKINPNDASVVAYTPPSQDDNFVSDQCITSVEVKQHSISVEVAPNPSSSYIHLLSEVNKIKKVSAVTLAGTSLELELSNKSVDIRELAPGLYTLIIQTENGEIATNKFIKE